MVQIGCAGFVQEMAHGEPSLRGLSPKVGKDSSKPAWIGASKRVPLKGHRLEKRCRVFRWRLSHTGKVVVGNVSTLFQNGTFDE